MCLCLIRSAWALSVCQVEVPFGFLLKYFPFLNGFRLIAGTVHCLQLAVTVTTVPHMWSGRIHSMKQPTSIESLYVQMSDGKCYCYADTVIKSPWSYGSVHLMDCNAINSIDCINEILLFHWFLVRTSAFFVHAFLARIAISLASNADHFSLPRSLCILVHSPTPSLQMQSHFPLYFKINLKIGFNAFMNIYQHLFRFSCSERYSYVLLSAASVFFSFIHFLFG